MTDIAQDLIAWRKAHGWTQVQSAEALDVPVATLRNWEQGRTRPEPAGPVRRLMGLLQPAKA